MHLCRAMLLETRNDIEKTVEASLSSETPYYRPGSGYEVLLHTPAAVDLSRAPLPLLTSHNSQETPVGIIEAIRIEAGKLRARLRFGGSQRALDIWEDVKAGVLRSISVGYQVIETKPSGDDTYIVTRWMPYEASLVSVPADPTVGVGRNFQGASIMPENIQVTENQSRSQRRAVTRAGAEAVESMVEINAMSQQFGITPGQVRAFVDEHGADADFFRQHVINQLRRGGGGTLRPSEDSEVGLSRREVKQFSFIKAIMAQVDPQFGMRNAGLELEASRAMAQKLGREPQGIFVPAEVLMRRDMVVGTPSSGGYLRPTEHMPESFVDVLRNAAFVMQLGASDLKDLRGDLSIPRKDGSTSAQWVAEGNAPSQSDMGFGQVALSPKTVGGWSVYSRKMMLQASPDIETLVRADLASTIAVEIDRAAIAGSGTGAEPLGILNASGVGAVAIDVNGGIPTWGHVLDLEQSLALSNADAGKLAYLASTKVRRKLKSTLKISGDAGAGFVWQPGTEPGIGSMNGFPAAASNNVPSNLTKGTGTGLSAMIFGNWADLFIGLWGGLDILVDPYTLSTSGGFRVVALMDVDIALRRAQSFAVIKDAVTI